MIQRIQSLFLLAAAVLSGLLLTGNLVQLSTPGGTLFNLGFSGLSEDGGEVIQRLWPLAVILALVPLLAVTAIFLYRKRSVQMRVTMVVILLSLGTVILGAFYVLTFDRKIDVTLVWTVKAVFPLLSAIFAWLAYRAILSDEMKVRSYDRLR
jgi:hypothetical protein